MKAVSLRGEASGGTNKTANRREDLHAADSGISKGCTSAQLYLMGYITHVSESTGTSRAEETTKILRGHTRVNA